jgi:hypothetical protein
MVNAEDLVSHKQTSCETFKGEERRAKEEGFKFELL